MGDEVHFSGTVGNPFDLVSAGAGGWLELRVRDTGLREQFDIALRGSSGVVAASGLQRLVGTIWMALTGSPGTLIDAYLTIESNGRHQTYWLLVDPHLTTDRSHLARGSAARASTPSESASHVLGRCRFRTDRRRFSLPQFAPGTG